MKHFQISTPEIFSYDLTLSFLTRNHRELLHEVAGQKIFKALVIQDDPILFSVSMSERVLDITAVNRPFHPAEADALKSYIRKWFDLDTDLRSFYQHVSNDKLLAPLIKEYFGYRIVGQPDLFESLVWAVLGQQINLSFAYTLKQRFVLAYGRHVQWKDRSYYIFPSPKDVAQLAPDVLLPLQFSRQKASYTVEIAQAFAGELIDPAALQAMPLADAKERLMRIKGVGNWTANYALMKTFQFRDAFPLEDAGLHNALKNRLSLKEKPSKDKILRIFKKYEGWEAYATLYLWKSL